jgi:hypothetical protein
MPSYRFIKFKEYITLYEIISYWDKDKKRPDNTRIPIGKVQKDTGRIIFKQNFLDRYDKNTIITKSQIIDLKNPFYIDKLIDKKNVENKDIIEVNDDVNIDNNTKSTSDRLNTIQEILDTHKKYGLKYLFDKIADKIKLKDILRRSIKSFDNIILPIVYYMISEHKAMMYCEDWVDENGLNNSFNFSSQRISDLFNKITKNDRTKFYKLWIEEARENEFLAVDITSVSSYSKTIEDCEFGYNSDKEKLKQINISTLFGEKHICQCFKQNLVVVLAMLQH